MNYIISGHDYIADMQPMVQAFYPYSGFTPVDAPADTGITIYCGIENGECESLVYDCAALQSRAVIPAGNTEKQRRMAVKKAVYLALSDFLGVKNPWGLLTGIRPAKFVSEMLKTDTEENVIKTLSDDFFVSPVKTKLAIDVSRNESRLFMDGSYKDKVSIYIGIPFCPTTCLYCSFTSYPIAKYLNKQDAYLSALFKELEFIVSNLDKPIDTVYIGGGTPTSLSETDFARLLEKVTSLIDIKSVREFSVEAGRPDTITVGKLSAMKENGVTRISINPQTANLHTLQLIGRNHTVEDFVNSYENAVSAGFDNINVDTILGLPGEALEDVKRTFELLDRLNPASITVHTLAVKRASRLMETIRKAGIFESPIKSAELVMEMLSYSQEFMKNRDYIPYYMYRQKNMLGNFENVGYSKPGFECLYNALIMEEVQTVWAAGAGAVSKFVYPDKIERVFNVKNVDEYLLRLPEMIERKSLRM